MDVSSRFICIRPADCRVTDGWSFVQEASWFWCAAGLALAMPLGVRFKTYSPLVYFGLGGTAVDLVQGTPISWSTAKWRCASHKNRHHSNGPLLKAPYFKVHPLCTVSTCEADSGCVRCTRPLTGAGYTACRREREALQQVQVAAKEAAGDVG